MPKFSSKADKIYVTHVNIRQSIFFLLLKLIFLDVMFVIVVVLYFSLISNKYIPGFFNGSMLSYNLPFFLTLVIVKILLSIYVVLKWTYEYYESWPNFSLHKSGFIFKNQEKHPLSHIRSIRLEQGFLGKTFGFGTVSVYDWYLEKYTSLYLIHNPVKYYNIIESLIPRTEEEKQIFQEVEE
jgi:membrane protein YdbS with pleckstrin-like domain